MREEERLRRIEQNIAELGGEIKRLEERMEGRFTLLQSIWKARTRGWS